MNRRSLFSFFIIILVCISCAFILSSCDDKNNVNELIYKLENTTKEKEEEIKAELNAVTAECATKIAELEKSIENDKAEILTESNSDRISELEENIKKAPLQSMLKKLCLMKK